jgi:hypothetical protein
MSLEGTALWSLARAVTQGRLLGAIAPCPASESPSAAGFTMEWSPRAAWAVPSDLARGRMKPVGRARHGSSACHSSRVAGSGAGKARSSWGKAVLSYAGVAHPGPPTD